MKIFKDMKILTSARRLSPLNLGDVSGNLTRVFIFNYQLDRHYREFYFEFDQLFDTDKDEKLIDLVGNIYTDKYLADLLPKCLMGSLLKRICFHFIGVSLRNRS